MLIPRTHTRLFFGCHLRFYFATQNFWIISLVESRDHAQIPALHFQPSWKCSLALSPLSSTTSQHRHHWMPTPADSLTLTSCFVLPSHLPYTQFKNLPLKRDLTLIREAFSRYAVSQRLLWTSSCWGALTAFFPYSLLFSLALCWSSMKGVQVTSSVGPVVFLWCCSESSSLV